ncbi:DNA primase small subunit PriS [Haloarchaeobius sp. HRN-SO-5]|uniref:DNA primase small subunit PriS n=1 Tax=Haloarchaeobius sp. HRN-SO-5 TaxID=3446118 RepID=UPI003EB9CA80
MDERTRRYLRGRFGDHYRQTTLSPPPAPNEREWGYITWSSGGTTMVRHNSWLEIGDLGGFLADERPRHVYFSAGRYDDPGAGSMTKKGWRSSDLVFDLDADHLPGVDPETDSYAAMLSVCKDVLLRLLDLLETDFGFEDLTVVFSGGRGYHVHVRDESVAELDRRERREVVDYVRANGLDFETLLQRETVAGLGLENPTDKRSLDTTGGWGRRVHRRLLNFVDEIRELPAEDARDRLESFDGIGSGRSKKLVEVLDDRYEELAAGNVDVHPTVVRLASIFAEETFDAETAPIDEPVTTDINRLIRLPGSLHGGTGLTVTRIDRDAVEQFEPLHDAVPGTFVGNDIRVEVTEPVDVELGGGSFTFSAGAHSVPEYVGVYLMARGDAEKGTE